MLSILDSVDSTNNYAMGMIHADLAKDGMAWFARQQTAGKGQPGKIWESSAGQNILLSIAIKPAEVFFQNQFYFNAAVTLACFDLFKSYAGDETSIKWPNDIYWRDRKAGGILIENKLMGETWKWAVVGIGININQTSFSKRQVNAVSLKQITGKEWDPMLIAKELHELILFRLKDFSQDRLNEILVRYNENLYKKDQIVRLKQDGALFETRIKAVNESGELQTIDNIERKFRHGEVEFVFQHS